MYADTDSELNVLSHVHIDILTFLFRMFAITVFRIVISFGYVFNCADNSAIRL